MYIRYTSWVTHAIKCITITVFKHLLMFQQHAPEFHYPHFIITNAFVCLHVSSINVTLETCLTLRVYLQNPNSLLFPLFPKNKSTSSRFSVTFGYCERYITVNDSGIMIFYMWRSPYIFTQRLSQLTPTWFYWKYWSRFYFQMRHVSKYTTTSINLKVSSNFLLVKYVFKLLFRRLWTFYANLYRHHL